MKTLEKLRQYLSNTSKEQFDIHWKEVEGVGVTGVKQLVSLKSN